MYNMQVKEELDMLDINKASNGNEMVITLKGRLDTLTAPQLEEELSACLDGVEKLVFDFGELSYISSAGLRVLLSAQKTMNTKGSMTVKNVSEEIREIFDVTGFSDILTIE